MSDPILVVGSVALDAIETPFAVREDVLGGAAVPFSAAASLFTLVRLVGVIGEDFPLEELEVLKQRGVDLEGLSTAPGPSFRWRGRYHLDMDHRDTLALELGVYNGYRPELPESYRASPVVFLANIDPAVQLHVLEQVRAPRLVACDTINHWITEQRPLVDELFKRVDLVFLNEEEARLYADTPNLHRAAAKILARGCRAVLIKKGEHGALVMAGSNGGATTFATVAYPLEEVVDPTGAGDVFAGGVMGWLASHGSWSASLLHQAAVVGSVLASFCVEDFGSRRVTEVTLDDVRARYESIRQMVSFEPSL